MKACGGESGGEEKHDAEEPDKLIKVCSLNADSFRIFVIFLLAYVSGCVFVRYVFLFRSVSLQEINIQNEVNESQ